MRRTSQQVANEYVGAPEPFYYDVVDVTRQQYQNLFAEALRVFGAHIRECIPFGKEFFFMKDADVYDSTIKLVLCKDEQGHNRRCTIDELKEECLKVPNCAGFNSNGYLKSYIRKGETTGACWQRALAVEGTDLYVRHGEYVGNTCRAT